MVSRKDGTKLSFAQQFALFKTELEGAVDESLLQEVAEEVKDIMQQQLNEVVYSYDARDEAMLTRRYDNGGLRDRSMMIASVGEAHTLEVQDFAPLQDNPSNHELADIVCRGDGDYRQPYPRPFIQATEDESVASGRAYDALMSGLQKRGFHTE